MKNFKILLLTCSLPLTILTAQNKEQRELIIKQSGLDKVVENEINNYNNNRLQARGGKLNIYDPQLYIDGRPIYFKTFNSASARMLNANAIYPSSTLNLNVTGSNIKVGVWDEGKVFNSHVDLVNKIEFGDISSDAATYSLHASHVTGTIIGSGINLSAKGLAYGGTAKTYDWNSDTSEMTIFARAGYLVSNHSYGFDANNLSNSYFGKYISVSRQFDLIMNNYPYYQIVAAAGNDRNDSSIQQVIAKSGYDLLTGHTVSKNVIVVGAIDVFGVYSPGAVTMSTFSNYGPTDDGRIKPDVVAKGVRVTSVGIASTSSYSTLQGTSMASPAITGLISLIQDHHFTTRNSFLKSHSIRALLIHSAREAGVYEGPDYSFGWGIPDAISMVNVISDKEERTHLFSVNTLVNGGKYTKDIAIGNVQNLDFTIAWTDPAGSIQDINNEDIKTPVLVHDLDLKVYKLKGDGISIEETFYPWKLNPINVLEPATRNSDNSVDNVEKVQIKDAQPGIYRIEVSHKGALTRNEEFTLVANIPDGNLSSQKFSQANLTLYPNPAVDKLYIVGADTTIINNALIQIYSLDGKLIKEFINKGYSSSEINVSDLISGFYLIKISSNGKSFASKFVKK